MPAPHLPIHLSSQQSPTRLHPPHYWLVVVQAAQMRITAGYSSSPLQWLSLSLLEQSPQLLLLLLLLLFPHQDLWVFISLNCSLPTRILHHLEAAGQDSKYLTRAGEESLHWFYLTPQEKRVAPSEYQQWHSRLLPHSHQKCHHSRYLSISQDFPTQPSKTK